VVFCLAAVLAIGATACGSSGSRKAGPTPRTSHQTDQPPSQSTAQPPSQSTAEPPSQSTGQDDGLENPTPTFRKKLEDGDCEEVAADADRLLATSAPAAVLAQLHVYRAVARGCTGDVDAARADVAIAQSQRDLLDDASRKILEEIETRGVPQSRAEVRTILVPVRTVPPAANQP
jgi:hypothetical protein